MNLGDKFEDMVAATIKEFDIFSGPNAKIFQKKVYPGARDPNGYEIDISIELMLTSELFFLIIIECKDHARPIERSYVQQFIQVRDDISAQKGIIVSTKGFNRGAVRLAENNRIALWKWGKPRFDSILRSISIEEYRNEMRKKVMIEGSILYFQKRGIIIKKDSLSSYPILEGRHNELILTQISSHNSTSENGYIDVDILSKLREPFFLDIINAILESKTSESHELQSYINSQYEKIHQKDDSITITRKIRKPSDQKTQNFKKEEDEKFPWECNDEEEFF